jgi:hypothetical protein
VVELLLCAGLAQSPAWSPHDRRAWGFLIEHAASIHPQPGYLRIIDESRDWDSRMRTLFAERLGLGVAVWHLWRQFKVIHIADAAPFISRALLEPTNPYYGKQLRLTGAHGELRPDFLCLTGSSEAVLAESKGAFGAPSAISAAEKRKAKDQLNNVQPVGVNLRASENRLAFATNLRIASEQVNSDATDTGVYVGDPDGNDHALNIRASADEIVIDAYSKLFIFLGFGWLAHLLRRGVRPISIGLEEEDRLSVHQEQLVMFQRLLGYQLGLPVSLVKTLLEEPADGVASRVTNILERSPLLSRSREPGRLDQDQDLLIFPNGLIGTFG